VLPREPLVVRPHAEDTADDPEGKEAQRHAHYG
jgi:hypothetical protein